MSPALAPLVVCLAFANVASADDGQRRGRGRRGDGRVIVQPRVVVRPPIARHYSPRRHYYADRLAYRPVFRPGLGVGIYIGSPYRYAYPRPNYRAYPYSFYGQPYGQPYGYGQPYPYAYGYPPPSAIYALPPPDALYGGVRLGVSPSDAAVYVDGYYAGIVDDFDGAWQRVALEPGPHRFEVAAAGYETVVFEVNVRPGQTVHYRADMRPELP